MTITTDTADALEALALSIFNPEMTPDATGNPWGKGVGLTGPDASIDEQYYTLVAPVALAIDGRTMPQGWRYTLNITNALSGRPKHWYMSLGEHDSSGYGWPVNCMLEFHDQPGYIADGANSFGGTLGLATCAAICNAWAKIIRRWLAGNYPLAVTQPTQ